MRAVLLAGLAALTVGGAFAQSAPAPAPATASTPATSTRMKPKPVAASPSPAPAQAGTDEQAAIAARSASEARIKRREAVQDKTMRSICTGC